MTVITEAGLQGCLEGGMRRLRRALTTSERLLLVCWYMDRIGLHELDERDIDPEVRNRVIVHLLGAGMSREDVARSFHLTPAGLSRIVNRIKREHGVKVTAEKSAAESRRQNPGCQVAHEKSRTR